MAVRMLDPAGKGAAQIRDIAGSAPRSELRRVSAGNYTVEDNVATVEGYTHYGPVTIYLPRAGLNAGQTIVVRKSDAGQEPVKIQAATGDLIMGRSWVTLTSLGEYANFLSDGKSTWNVPLHF